MHLSDILEGKLDIPNQDGTLIIIYVSVSLKYISIYHSLDNTEILSTPAVREGFIKKKTQ